jgi:hypothetical protein
MPYRPLESDASLSFELPGNRGAALVTKYSTYGEDSPLESTFEAYTKRHYESWVKFACDKQCGSNIYPVLVTGFDMTEDFTMVAYTNDDASLESWSTVDVPMVASASAPIQGTWHTRSSSHTSSGPHQYGSPPHERAEDSPFLQSVGTGSVPNELNQCVFIQYYTMRSRKGRPMFPKVNRAGAGPHDLDSGNRGDAFPELVVRPDAGPIMNSDEHLGGQQGLATDDANPEPDIISPNTPYVRPSPRHFVLADPYS